jgi:hypothetical protein
VDRTSRDAGWAVQTKDRSGKSPFLGAGRREIGWAKSTPESDAEFRWNPTFWQGVDNKVQSANDHGMITFFCAIGQNHSIHNFPKTSRPQVELFARNFRLLVQSAQRRRHDNRQIPLYWRARIPGAVFGHRSR